MLWNSQKIETGVRAKGNIENDGTLRARSGDIYFRYEPFSVEGLGGKGIR